MNYGITIFLFISSLLILSCQSEEKQAQTNNNTLKELHEDSLSFRLQPIDDIPAEIEGCSCYFSKDSIAFKKKRHLFVDNFEDLAFIQVNKELVRLKRIKTEEYSDFSVKSDYTDENYTLTIKVYEGESSGEETWMNWGEIWVKNKAGEKYYTRFYGECGC